MLTLNSGELARTLRAIAAKTYENLRLPPFSLEVHAEESFTRHGDYSWDPRLPCPSIRIFNLARPTRNIIKTSIHE